MFSACEHRVVWVCVQVDSVSAVTRVVCVWWCVCV